MTLARRSSLFVLIAALSLTPATTIFSDGFESGDASAWSSSVP